MRPIDLLRVHLDATCPDDELISLAIERMTEDTKALAAMACQLDDLVTAARGVAGMGSALIRDNGQSYNLSQTGHHQTLVAALKALDKSTFPEERTR